MENSLTPLPSDDTTPEQIFREYYARLCFYAFQFVKDEKVAEDLVQDAFVSYWKKREKVAKNPLAIKNFLYTSTRNACFNWQRKNKTIARFQQIFRPIVTEDPMYLEMMIRAEVLAEVYKIVASLPPACATVFKKGYLEGLSNPEIAQELGISINTVKAQKRRALVVLRAKLRPELYSLFLSYSFLV